MRTGAFLTPRFVIRLAPGHGNACNWLGHMFDKGDGVEKSAESALKFNRMAADAGDAWAQTKMGLRYEAGDGVPPDTSVARGWFEKAAKHKKGGDEARSRLAQLPEAGAASAATPAAAAPAAREGRDADAASTSTVPPAETVAQALARANAEAEAATEAVRNPPLQPVITPC